MNKESLIVKALIAHAIGSHNDLLQIMRRILSIPLPLRTVERMLLYDAYRDVCEDIKQSIIKLFDFCASTIETINERQLEVIRSYYTELRNELAKNCEEIIDVLDNYLIPASCIDMDNETITLFFTMKAIHYTYLAEFTFEPPVREVWINEAETAYKNAYRTAEYSLSPVNPKRLAVVLNYCAFINNLQLDLPRACILAREELQKVSLERRAGIEISDVAANIIREIKNNMSISRRMAMGMIFPGMEYESPTDSDS